MYDFGTFWQCHIISIYEVKYFINVFDKIKLFCVHTMFTPDQQKRHEDVRSYCPNIYTVLLCKVQVSWCHGTAYKAKHWISHRAQRRRLTRNTICVLLLCRMAWFPIFWILNNLCSDSFGKSGFVMLPELTFK